MSKYLSDWVENLQQHNYGVKEELEKIIERGDYHFEEEEEVEAIKEEKTFSEKKEILSAFFQKLTN